MLAGDGRTGSRRGNLENVEKVEGRHSRRSACAFKWPVRVLGSEHFFFSWSKEALSRSGTGAMHSTVRQRDDGAGLSRV